MDNQHRKIKGYRELSQKEIDVMNKIKEHGILLGNLVNELQEVPEIDRRWLAIGITELQQGLMALTRSIARPDFF
jgi:hypothetical protein